MYVLIYSIYLKHSYIFCCDRRREECGEVPQEVVELIQSGIDDMLEEKAERTHLTAIHVKNIIKVCVQLCPHLQLAVSHLMFIIVVRHKVV